MYPAEIAIESIRFCSLSGGSTERIPSITGSEQDGLSRPGCCRHRYIGMQSIHAAGIFDAVRALTTNDDYVAVCSHSAARHQYTDNTGEQTQ